MNKIILNLIKHLEIDKGKKINKLIETGMFTIEDITKEAIESEDRKLIFLTALYVKEASTLKLASAFIKIKDTNYIKFQKDIIKDVIESKDAILIYLTALYVEEAPIDELADAIIRKKRANYIYNFTKYVKGAPITKLWTAINSIKEEDDPDKTMYVDLFYKKIILPLEKSVSLNSDTFEGKPKTRVRSPEKESNGN